MSFQTVSVGSGQWLCFGKVPFSSIHLTKESSEYSYA